MPEKKVVVFVHGWSVTNTDTYGGLPRRLRAEAATAGIDIQIEEIFLGKYISFHDEVRVKDISRAFRAAVEDELSNVLEDGTRFICITHSTGGPVIRDWWHRYYKTNGSPACPMSHLVMLAPANHGSALAQLGKGKLSRMKFWFEGVEPGQGVLDWLELGSSEAWDLNVDWIHNGGDHIGPDGVFPFVLTGQYVDRSFYDQLNSYTGELGSDGVVRVAAANLMGTYIKLAQETPVPSPQPKEPDRYEANKLEIEEVKTGPVSAMRVIAHKSHSGEDMGIMRSVKASPRYLKSKETIEAILACIKVKTSNDYDDLCEKFEAETKVVQKNELLEVEKHIFRSPTYFFHDKFSMVIFRVRDNEGYPVTDFDLILTAGPDADPNHLPKGFFADRQRNSVTPETITYFFNRDVMKGTDPVKDKNGKEVRGKIDGAEALGFKIISRPGSGFVHYLPCEFTASSEMLEKALHGNSTTLVDIQLQRVVRKNVFRLDKMEADTKPVNFIKTKPGNEIAE